jgi:dipeptidase
MFSFFIRLQVSLLFFVCVIQTEIVFSQNNPENDESFSCTTITLGKNASADGSVITSHTCDSHRTRSWLDITAPKEHKEGAMQTMVKRIAFDSLAMPANRHIAIGEIPEVSSTYGFINTAYPCMNDHQLAVGESTFGGRPTLKSDNGLIDCQQLVKLMLERCTTARQAINLSGAGKGNRGAIWAAQRVPDNHVSVNANSSRIRQIDMDDPDYFMYSDNFTKVAQDSGWWSPSDGPFEFCYAYNPTGRTSFAATRREWRVFDLVAPSLKLHPNSENFPFSVKPDTLVTLEKLVKIFEDYYEGTDFNIIKNLTWINKDGKTEISPLANPFMPYDMNKLFKINGGWGWLGERTIARWYTMYATITQSRDWLPNEIGGVVWLAMDNVATSIYVPLYCSITDVPKSYKVPGRINGYTRESAWWAFNRLGTLSAQRWGDMRHDVRNVWDPIQTELFKSQLNFEQQALNIYRNNPGLLKEYLTNYSIKYGQEVVIKAWKLGDFLWTKYDEKF